MVHPRTQIVLRIVACRTAALKAPGVIDAFGSTTSGPPVVVVVEVLYVIVSVAVVGGAVATAAARQS